jgi:hypothetical protein
MSILANNTATTEENMLSCLMMILMMAALATAPHSTGYYVKLYLS